MIQFVGIAINPPYDMKRTIYSSDVNLMITLSHNPQSRLRSDPEKLK
jgi:hypothetical protein